MSAVGAQLIFQTPRLDADGQRAKAHIIQGNVLLPLFKHHFGLNRPGALQLHPMVCNRKGGGGALHTGDLRFLIGEVNGVALPFHGALCDHLNGLGFLADKALRSLHRDDNRLCHSLVPFNINFPHQLLHRLLQEGRGHLGKALGGIADIEFTRSPGDGS